MLYFRLRFRHKMAEMSQQVEIPNRALFKAAEVCDLVKVQPYVLRSWEAEFKNLGFTKSGSTTPGCFAACNRRSKKWKIPRPVSSPPASQSFTAGFIIICAPSP